MVIELDDQNFSKEVTVSDIPVIIDFWAPWCMPCRMLAPIFEEVSKDFTGKLKFTKVNVQQFQELAEQFDVSGIPCLVLVKHGKEFGRIVRFQQKNELKKEINAILSKK